MLYVTLCILLDFSIHIDTISMDPDKEFHECEIVIILLPINLNMCFGCSKEPSHGIGCVEYPPHMFWLRNKENSFPIRTLVWRPA